MEKGVHRVKHETSVERGMTLVNIRGYSQHKIKTGVQDKRKRGAQSKTNPIFQTLMKWALLHKHKQLLPHHRRPPPRLQQQPPSLHVPQPAKDAAAAGGHRRRCRRLEQASRIVSFLPSSPRATTWRHHFPSRETPTPRSVKAAGDDAKPYQKRRRPPRCSKVLEPLPARATPGLEATPPSLTVAPQLWSEPSSLSPFDLCFTIANCAGLWWWIWSVVLSCLWCMQIRVVFVFV